MEAVRTIVSAERLTPLISLPWNTKNLQDRYYNNFYLEKNTLRCEVSVENLEGCLTQRKKDILFLLSTENYEDI